jgi:transposase-like protein
MNQKQKALYLQNRGSKCPYCQSENVENSGNREFDEDWATNEIACLDCQKTWKDFYLLSDVIED